MTASVRIGTRSSALAMSQAGTVADAISRASGVDAELVGISTHGDLSSQPLSQQPGTGVFVSALRTALLAGECDLVVHSMKDLPTDEVTGLKLGAVPKRADARDALCSRDGLSLDALPAGARVGTGSPRRKAQLLSVRDDLEVIDIRGNVDSRLDRVHGADADLDAVVLAAAGLGRLGREDAITERFDLHAWPTSPGQGALAVETRDDATDAPSPLARALARLDHTTTRAVTLAERTVLAVLEAGCSSPVGATASVDSGLLFVTATVYPAGGGEGLTSSHAASLESTSAAGLREAALDAARRVADELLANGAAQMERIGSRP